MSISIIIPTYNEEENISDLLNLLQKNISKDKDIEIIVADGGSDDNTIALADNFENVNSFISENKGRAAQMNAGVDRANGDILYFVHADSRPPESYVDDILQALENGYSAGCYRFQFDSGHPLLKINAFCTRFDLIMCRGGDQTLFITRDLFNKLGGYKNYMIMEDYDLITRIQNTTSFRIIPKDVIVSSRKYLENGYFQVQIANFIVFMMYFLDYSQQAMVDAYKQLIYYPKF